MISVLKKFKVQIALVLGYKKRNDPKIFNLNQFASYSDIDDACKSIHQLFSDIISNNCHANSS